MLYYASRQEGVVLGTQTDTITNDFAKYRPLLLDMQLYILQMRTLAEGLPESEESTSIYQIGRHGLRMLDAALYALDANQTELPLSTMSTTAVAHDVCQELQGLAQRYGAEVVLDVSGHPAAAYSNPQAVHGAMHALAASMIMSLSSDIPDRRVIVSVHQTRQDKQRLGVFVPSLGISQAALSHASDLSTRSRSAAPSLFAHSSTGVVVSQQLTEAIGSRLRAFRRQGVAGAGFYVPVSPQLSFLG